jgi:hypothetical protein
VHGINAAGDAVVVRYDRAGKWYLEPIGVGKRRAITLAQAADIARLGRAFIGRPGGGRFDALLRSVSSPGDAS